MRPYKNQILFRFTICSADDKVLSFWEPGAPNIEDRMKALKHAYMAGYETSVSCEPMLDDRIDKVVDLVKPYVSETIWIGKMNKIDERLKTNGANYETINRAAELKAFQNDEAIISLYEKYKNDPFIKWKDSIQEVLEKCGYDQ